MSTRPKSALIIGMDGSVGARLCRVFRSRGIRVYGTTRRSPVCPSDIFLDLADPDFSRHELPQTDVAIICASANGFAYCRSNPENAKQINVDAPRILTHDLTSRGTRVIYLSSSAVFDFSRPHMATSSRYCPSTIYGKSKAAGEEGVLSVGNLATIVRLTKVLTPDIALFLQWIDTLRSGKSVTAFSDLHFCPISLEYVASALLAITKAGAPGIFHVSGATDVSYFDAALHFARKIGVAESRIVEDRAASKGIPHEEIATFTSLDASRYNALTGEIPPRPLDVLDAVYGPLIGNAMAVRGNAMAVQ